MDGAVVRAVGRLTTRWAARAVTGERGTVLTAAGVWPLLALLADGADGPARAELAEALGVPAGSPPRPGRSRRPVRACSPRGSRGPASRSAPSRRARGNPG
ncbi:hypothetical protein [Streptomyces goshikiensis]|uniref:hypothetical protein n=1 Tax=Streptomyces goshikiensis TaxID=1942 RepID=UPI0036DDE5D7